MNRWEGKGKKGTTSSYFYEPPSFGIGVAKKSKAIAAMVCITNFGTVR